MSREKTHVYGNTVRTETDEEAVVIFGGAGEFVVGPAPEFGGRSEVLNPEELFVAAINGCLMTTFFYFLAKAHIEIQSYEAYAEGHVEKNANGFRFVGVQIQATATVREPRLAERICELAGLAEKYCLVSRSVSCPVHYDLHVEIGEEEDR
jgi:organic hydroperoxide reductase OsmC/OhrA